MTHSSQKPLAARNAALGRGLAAAAVALAFALAGCGAPLDTEETLDTPMRDVRGAPNGKGGGTVNGVRTATVTPYATTGNGIAYHGGPIMSSNTNVYLIWYGNWSGNPATTIITDWARSIGGSSYYNINTTYDDNSGNRVRNSVTYAGSTSDSYSRGTALSDADIQTIVSSALSSGRLPVDYNGVYFVLTSSDVTATSGFCTSYCGWHTHGTLSGTDIKYSFVGNSDRCPSACRVQESSPNGNAGADGMISVLSHELEETTSDPDLNAWYDTSGWENADKCAWTFGTEYAAPNGTRANMRMGGRDYLIQQNWVNASGGYCATSYNSVPPYGATISITAQANMRFVCAENAGGSPLIANRDAVGAWEQFQVVNLGNGYVALKALVNGMYVCAENAGASSLIANRSAVGSWETFQWIDLGNGYFALKATVNGKYVTAENGGGSSLIANRTAIGAWEMFHWEYR